jgi:hypothetical protein
MMFDVRLDVLEGTSVRTAKGRLDSYDATVFDNAVSTLEESARGVIARRIFSDAVRVVLEPILKIEMTALQSE